MLWHAVLLLVWWIPFRKRKRGRNDEVDTFLFFSNFLVGFWPCGRYICFLFFCRAHKRKCHHSSDLTVLEFLVLPPHWNRARRVRALNIYTCVYTYSGEKRDSREQADKRCQRDSSRDSSSSRGGGRRRRMELGYGSSSAEVEKWRAGRRRRRRGWMRKLRLRWTTTSAGHIIVVSYKREHTYFGPSPYMTHST